jgi:hypothetical protein
MGTMGGTVRGRGRERDKWLPPEQPPKPPPRATACGVEMGSTNDNGTGRGTTTTGTGTTGSRQNDGDQGTALATTRPTGKVVGDHHDRPRMTCNRDSTAPQPPLPLHEQHPLLPL